MSSARLELIQINRQLENENRMLKFSLHKYDRTLRETEVEAASTQKWINELYAEINSMNAKLSESEAELRAKQAEKEGLQQELNELKAQMAALEERLSQAVEPTEVDPETVAIEKEIDDLQSQVEQLKSRKQTTEALLEEKRAELDTQKKSLEWKETELKAAAEIATFLQQKMDELDRDFSLTAASVSSSAPSVGLPSILAKPVAQDGALSQHKDSMEVDEKAKHYNSVGWNYSSDAPPEPKLNIAGSFIRGPPSRLSDGARQRVSINDRVSLQGGRNIAVGTSSAPIKRKRPPIVYDRTAISQESPLKRCSAQMEKLIETCDTGSIGSVTAQDNGCITTSSPVSQKKRPPVVYGDFDDKKPAVIRLVASRDGMSTDMRDEKITTSIRSSVNVSTSDEAETSMKKEGTVARSVDDDHARRMDVQAGCTLGTPSQKKRPPIMYDEAGPSTNAPFWPPAAGNFAASIVRRKHPAIIFGPNASLKDTAGLLVLPKHKADGTNTQKSSRESIHSLIVDESDLPTALPALKVLPSIRDNNTKPVKENEDAAAAKKRPPIKWP